MNKSVCPLCNTPFDHLVEGSIWIYGFCKNHNNYFGIKIKLSVLYD